MYRDPYDQTQDPLAYPTGSVAEVCGHYNVQPEPQTGSPVVAVNEARSSVSPGESQSGSPVKPTFAGASQAGLILARSLSTRWKSISMSRKRLSIDQGRPPSIPETPSEKTDTDSSESMPGTPDKAMAQSQASWIPDSQARAQMATAAVRSAGYAAMTANSALDVAVASVERGADIAFDWWDNLTSPTRGVALANGFGTLPSSASPSPEPEGKAPQGLTGLSPDRALFMAPITPPLNVASLPSDTPPAKPSTPGLRPLLLGSPSMHRRQQSAPSLAGYVLGASRSSSDVLGLNGISSNADPRAASTKRFSLPSPSKTPQPQSPVTGERPSLTIPTATITITAPSNNPSPIAASHGDQPAAAVSEAHGTDELAAPAPVKRIRRRTITYVRS